MKRLIGKSLTIRIWATFTIVILFIICSISIIYFLVYKNISENNRVKDLKVAHNILLSSQDYNRLNRFDELNNLKGSDFFLVNKDESNSYVLDLPKDKDSIFLPNKDKPNPNDNKELKEWMASFASGEMNETEFREFYNSKKFIFIISSIEKDEKVFYLISFIPGAQDDKMFFEAILIAIVFIAIGFVTAKLIANYISRPLKQLEGHAIRIAHKDWRKPIKIKSEDEISRLADAMNFMQIELKRMDQEEKLFFQSISHDLKTPVMVIMSHAQAIIDGIYIDTVERTADIIKNEAINLEKKIKQLLYLNTLDYVMGNNDNRVEVDLNKLIYNIIDRFKIINNIIKWDVETTERSIIIGNPEKIQVSIENILDNALRYAENIISINLKTEGRFAVLDLYNDGPNISSESINHIFENLYKDRSGNFGLGLAISKKIIEFYKGEINVVNEEKGVRFSIKYPLK
jgi:two-component system sensor histidine kinase CssS